MYEFRFTVVIEGADVMTDAAQDLLFAAGCDAVFRMHDGVQTADFVRMGLDFAAASGSAVRAVEAAVPGARVVRVDQLPAQRAS
jgi:hypothetical protein